jgi:hypothetical protein
LLHWSQVLENQEGGLLILVQLLTQEPALILILVLLGALILVLLGVLILVLIGALILAQILVLIGALILVLIGARIQEMILIQGKGIT